MIDASKYIENARAFLEEKGQASIVDEMLLSQLGDAIEVYNKYLEDLRTFGTTVQYNSGPALSPAFKGMEATAKRIIMLSDKLGLSPRARKGIKIDTANENDQPSMLDTFLAQGWKG